jgi:hypothetical protein
MREVMTYLVPHLPVRTPAQRQHCVDDRVLLVQAAEFGEESTFMLVAWDQPT